MKNLCIIPARSGSKGVPGKNIKLLKGKPLINYTFEAAVACEFIDKVILSTDCNNIASLAAAYEVAVPFLRPKELAADTTPTKEVIEHAIEFLESQHEFFDNIILLQPTCPFRADGFVDSCIRVFIEKQADCLVSVRAVPHEYNPHWVFEEEQPGMLKISTGEQEIIPSRQLLPKAFIRDGSVYVFKRSNLTQYHSIYGKKIAYLESTDDLQINIDTPGDWQRAELIAEMKSSMN